MTYNFLSAPNHLVMLCALDVGSVSVEFVNVSLAEPTRHRSTVDHSAIVTITPVVSITTRCAEVLYDDDINHYHSLGKFSR